MVRTRKRRDFDLIEGRESLARLRGLPASGLRSAENAGVLTFDYHDGLPAWFIRDERAGCARRLDGKEWETPSGSTKAVDVRGTCGRQFIGWPVGALGIKDCDTVIICEGGPDLLAAYALRAVTGSHCGIVALLGAGLTVHRDARALFRGKSVRIIAHVDTSGHEFAERNGALLSREGADVSIARLDGLRAASGDVVSDLCDVLAFQEQRNWPGEILEVFDFTWSAARLRPVVYQRELLGPLGVGLDCVTEDNRERTEGGQPRTDVGVEREGEEGIGVLCATARSLCCTARHETQKKLFNLAREVRAFEDRHGGKCKPASDAAFEAWFTASRPNLDLTETRAQYLARYRGMQRKVRVPAGAGGETLRLAIERAKTSPLPEIPDAPDAPESWRLLAAVCRELQRSAGEAEFFITKRDAMRIVGGKYPMDGLRVLDHLDALEVIRCHNRGKPQQGTGNAARYRYLLPL